MLSQNCVWHLVKSGGYGEMRDGIRKGFNFDRIIKIKFLVIFAKICQKSSRLMLKYKESSSSCLRKS